MQSRGFTCLNLPDGDPKMVRIMTGEMIGELSEKSDRDDPDVPVAEAARREIVGLFSKPAAPPLAEPNGALLVNSSLCHNSRLFTGRLASLLLSDCRHRKKGLVSCHIQIQVYTMRKLLVCYEFGAV